MDLITNMKQSFLNDFESFLYNCGVGYADKIDVMVDKVAFIDTAYLYDEPVHIYQSLIGTRIYKSDGTTF